MSDYFYNKIDFIIMIILALIVAFIIGFGILQIIDNKLSSVTINVPSTNCSLPPIYLSVDKESNIKQIKLNDVVSTLSSETIYNNINNSIDDEVIGGIEEFTSINQNDSNQNNPNQNNPNQNNQIEIRENYGNIQDYPLLYDDDRRHLLSDVIYPDTGLKIISNKTNYQTARDPNYSTVNDIPLLFAPDTDVPNKAGPDAIGYMDSKVKLIEDPNSPLMKLAKENANMINGLVAKCSASDRTRVPEVNGTFDGYNAFVDLRTDSYANVTSIGKSMLSPYVSYPIPS